jgi:hypothetical protein
MPLSEVLWASATYWSPGTAYRSEVPEENPPHAVRDFRSAVLVIGAVWRRIALNLRHRNKQILNPAGNLPATLFVR